MSTQKKGIQKKLEHNPDEFVSQFAPADTNLIKNSNGITKKLKIKSFSKKKLLIVVFITLFGLSIVGFGTKSFLELRNTKKELNAIKNDPNTKAKEEAKKIVEQVAKLVILPENEDPTIATVTDPAKLSDQPFFINSEAGDKVLIYQEAKRAILYRPSNNKVIEIAPLNTDGINSGGVAGDEILNPK